MHLSSVDILRYGIGIGIEAGLCLLALHRGLQRRLRLFTIYLCAVFACDAIRWLPIIAWGLPSRETLWTYWITQSIMILLRGAAVVDLARYVLKPYTGIWILCKTILAAVGGALSATAVIGAWQESSRVIRMIVAADRGLELAILGLLLFALAFCRYYRVPVNRFAGLIAIGIGFYAAIQVANNTLVGHWLAYLQTWEAVRDNSYFISILFWVAALWRPLPDGLVSPALLDQRVYGQMIPVVSTRLRELNARIAEALK
ncbi:MAG: hypothetical protein ACRD4S_07445 [Candidatus Acidiferrales bacterium]